jgi:hypothetical protein
MISQAGRGLAVVLTLIATGCATQPKSEYDEYVDSQWRQGYGFNNPNPERIRKGQPPVNFDGSVEDGSWHWSDLFK